MNIILLGPPGSGKGTQAEKIASIYAIPHISTGNILRHAIENETKVGLEAKSYMDKGELVPDDVIDKIVEERLSYRDCNKGFILDGFPRDIYQAKELENIRGIEYVLDIQVPDELIVERLSQRRVCLKCGATYHLLNKPPKQDGVCDSCNSEISQRKDDSEETIKHRLEIYHKETEPLIEYYNKENLLIPLNGTKPLKEVYQEIKNHLEP